MRYSNPFRLFHISEKQQPDAAVVQQITDRMRLLYKQALSEPVFIGDHKLEASDLTQMQLEWEAAHLREFHRLVLAEYRKLFNFLEYGHLGLFREPEAQKHHLWENKAFIEFIKPYFLYAYNETLLLAVRQQDVEAVQQLSHHQIPIVTNANTTTAANEGNSEEQNQVVEILKNNTADLHNLALLNDLPAMSEREILSYLPDKYIEVFNALPDQFASLRNQLGYEVQNLAVILNNELGRSDGAEALVRQGLKLKLDEKLQRDLEAMLAHHRRGSFLPLWLLIGVGVIALLFLIQYLERG